QCAEGVWLTSKQQRELSHTYGDYGLLDSPNDVSDYIKANGIELKDAFKMCVKFCENHLKKEKR
ncbi:MAG TPA: hypothetical protein PKI15_10725, partial [Candidatus Cloacimonadota bacterium]|nr:hypothetical protein [Candidatus Cloacimonadota bacterium]